MVLRGCLLRNVESVIGLVIYTGVETKLLQNLRGNRQKVSSLVRTMNKLLLSLFCFQLLMTTLFTIWSLLTKDGINEYLVKPSELSSLLFFLQGAVQFVVAYSHMIPISLYVATEVLKIILVTFIENDESLKLINKTSARTSEIVEELGQIEIIFSDKTGTLTKNVMNCVLLSVSGVFFSLDESYRGSINAIDDMFNPEKINNEYRTKHTAKINELLCSMAVCHSALVEEERYVSSSPDEVALLTGAAKAGFIYRTKKGNTLEMYDVTNDNKINADVLIEIPFESRLKSMRVVVKLNGTFMLLVKGADEVMLRKCKLEGQEVSKIEYDITRMSEEGLRTLVFASKKLDLENFCKFEEQYKLINASDDRERLLNNLIEEFEKDMTYLGTSGIDDQLQDVEM